MDKGLTSTSYCSKKRKSSEFTAVGDVVELFDIGCNLQS